MVLALAKRIFLCAIKMHTTSKLTKIEDLLLLKSLGFRGEALASITAVSDFTITSSSNKSGIGSRLTGSCGEVINCVPCAKLQGTTIEINNLFKNVPARRKFQKHSKKKITQLLTAFALCYEDIAIKFIAEEKTILAVKPFSNRLTRIKELFNVTATVHKSTLENASLMLYLGAFPTNYLFVNGRFVKSTLLTKAIERHFHFMVDTPKFIAYLNINSESIDVNVHPQKKRDSLCR